MAGAKGKRGSDPQLLLLLGYVGLYHNLSCSRWPRVFQLFFAVLNAASIDHTAHDSLSPNNHAHVMAPTRHTRPDGSLLRPCLLDRCTTARGVQSDDYRLLFSATSLLLSVLSAAVMVGSMQTAVGTRRPALRAKATCNARNPRRGGGESKVGSMSYCVCTDTHRNSYRAPSG